MDTRTLAHISDLHIGKSPDATCRAVAIRDALMAAAVDHVVVTGDVTHRGRQAELNEFWNIFAPLRGAAQMTLVPGNHDRLGDDLSSAIQGNERVAVTRSEGLHLVRFDSTGPHNRAWLAGHGVMTEADITAIGSAVESAAADALVVVLLHHHVRPLPADHPMERLVSWLGYPYAEELEHGRALLKTLRGRCDLVLHGHRHTPQGGRLFEDEARPLSVYNAGSSTELGRVRVFCHARGQLLGPAAWLTTWMGPAVVKSRRRVRRQPEPSLLSAP